MIDPAGFLMIEPRGRVEPEVLDDLTIKVSDAWAKSRASLHGYRGFHRCSCGATSDNRDHYVMVGGVELKTNSLCVHYISRHRSEVPEEEMEKVRRL